MYLECAHNYYLVIMQYFRVIFSGRGQGHRIKVNAACIHIETGCMRPGDQKLFSDIQNGRWRPFCQKLKQIIKIRMDLKWPIMPSKVNFGHPI